MRSLEQTSMMYPVSVGLLMHLYDACVPPTASYGCEVWGLRELPAGEYKKGRDALGTLHLRVLKELATVPTSVSTDMLLQELGQRPLFHAWWRRTVKFWNTLVDLPVASIYKQVALDSCRDAVTHKVKNWAGGVFQGLRKIGYVYPVGFAVLHPLHIATVLQLLDAPALQAVQDLDICPRTCPSANATKCTYYRWFARPQHQRQSHQLLMQPLSARCMRTLLRFRLGAHNLPVVLGRRNGTPRDQRLCQRCDQDAVGDERHLIFECPAVQCVRDKYAALFACDNCTMQQFMWQADLVGVAHFVRDCFAMLDAQV